MWQGVEPTPQELKMGRIKVYVVGRMREYLGSQGRREGGSVCKLRALRYKHIERKMRNA